MRKRSGFSLIEIMVVVAIIGILATIAIPSYQKFSARARQAEAKGGLSAVFASEKGFFAENSTYTRCLFNIGGLTETRLDSNNNHIAVARAYYAIGFVSAGGLPNCGWGDCDHYTANDQCNALGIYESCSGANAGSNGSTSVVCSCYSGNCAGNSSFNSINSAEVTDSNTFTAGAAGDILPGSGFGRGVDAWTIDQDRVVKNILSPL